MPLSMKPGHEGLPKSRRPWAMTACLIAVALSVLDTVIANTALPAIGHDLDASPANSVWVVNAYQLALVVSLLPFASLGEIVGYRRVFITGLAVFTLASIGCATAWSFESLVAARLLQGFGASATTSVNTALIAFIYPLRELGRGVGQISLIVAISSALGPTVAAAVLSLGPWPWLFAINLPLGVIALVLAFKFLPHTARSPHRFDFKSAFLNAGAFGFLVLALGEAARSRTAAEVTLEAAAGVGFGLWLLRRQTGLPAPMFPLDLFRRPVFALSAVTSCCSFATQTLAYVALPFYLQGALGRSQVETGLLMTPWPVVVALMTPVAARLADHYPAALMGGFGLALVSLGMALLASLPEQPTVIDISWRMVVCGVGFGLFSTPNLRALMFSAPPERSGSASGIVSISRLTGQSIGAGLVALCFGVSLTHGVALALTLGAVFAGAASVVSFVRLAVK